MGLVYLGSILDPCSSRVVETLVGEIERGQSVAPPPRKFIYRREDERAYTRSTGVDPWKYFLSRGGDSWRVRRREKVISSRRKLNKRQTRESTLVGQIRGVFSLLSICFQATGHVFSREILTEIDRASFFLRFFHVLSFRQESLNRSRYHPPFPFSFLDQHPASISDLTHGHASVNFPLGSRILPRRKIPLSRLFAALFRFSKFSDHAIEEAVEKYSPG